MSVAAASVVVGCATYSSPATAGNRQIEYFLALQQGSYGTAYDMLCDSTRTSVALHDFVETRGEVLLPGWDPRTGGMMGGDYERVFDPDTESEDVTDTEVEAILSAANQRTTWRIHLQKEGDQWRLCTFTRLH